jgi:hypothetical protein
MFTVHSFSSLVLLRLLVARSPKKRASRDSVSHSMPSPKSPYWYFLDHRRSSLLPPPPVRVLPPYTPHYFCGWFQQREPILDVFAHNFARWYIIIREMNLLYCEPNSKIRHFGQGATTTVPGGSASIHFHNSRSKRDPETRGA